MPKGTCIVEGCDEPIKNGPRGLCNRHYAYARRHRFGVTHYIRPTVAESLWSRFEKSANGCWLWTGRIHTQSGYGLVLSDPYRMAHRVMFEIVCGELIPEGLTIDHLCHNRDTSCRGGDRCLHRRCVNPSHLEPCTSGENARRGMLSRPSCRKGHLLDDLNTRIDAAGHRWCRTCGREYMKAWYERNPR